MPLELLIPLILFVAVALILGLALRRIGLLVAKTRETASFRESVEDLAGRVDTTLDDIIRRIDALRRQQIQADEIAGPLDRTLEALLKYSEEARQLGGPTVAAGPKAAFAAEIDRADRALQMVEHGAAIMSTVSSRHRTGEAQTAIKRGYLNVVHAREALRRHAAEIATGKSIDETRWLTERSSADS